MRTRHWQQDKRSIEPYGPAQNNSLMTIQIRLPIRSSISSHGPTPAVHCQTIVSNESCSTRTSITDQRCCVEVLRLDLQVIVVCFTKYVSDECHHFLHRYGQTFGPVLALGCHSISTSPIRRQTELESTLIYVTEHWSSHSVLYTFQETL